MITWNNTFLGYGERGKLADSQDSFRFSYMEVDPRTENFSISATFEVEDVSEVDFQSGYGIMVVDTVENPSNKARYRNHLLVGRFRAVDGRNFACGVRVVGGYTNHEALPQDGKRKLDPSRLFKTQFDGGLLVKGDRMRFQLDKTDNVFKASMLVGSKEETIVFPGHDFLLKQDRKKIYVGIAIAGDMIIKVSDVHFETSPGKLGRTPEDAIRHHVPDYPFERSLLPIVGTSCADDPMDLSSTILQVTPGSEIILADGIYKGGPFYIPDSLSGESSKPIILRAEHPGKAIIDGSSFSDKLPAMILRGNHWVIDGLVFRGSPSCGLFICGSYNVIKGCEASNNGDTGVLICSFPGVSKKMWPSHNKVERCVSHDNCDRVRRNADGFGAKLSVGRGNVFYSCRAFHNIDDGFDLYTKSTLGPIAPVTLDNCEASYNGWLSGEERPLGEVRTGIGFKLGGENQKVTHMLVGCAAHHNARAGFDSNSNPSAILSRCEAWDNPTDFKAMEKKPSFKDRWRSNMTGFQMRLDRKILPKLLLHDPFSRNQSSIAKFEALIPELKYYEPNQVSSQLCRQALINGFLSLDRYYNIVVSNQEELSKLRMNLTFLDSHFFRGDIWPRLREECQMSFQGTPKDKILVWCAGCSNGKEVYSILMVLLDFIPAEKIELLATDYNTEMINKTREGVYPLKLINEIPTEYRHYVEAYIPDELEDIKRLRIQIPSKLRDMCQLRYLNLLSEEYPKGFDLILCRNVIKFFEYDTRRLVQAKLAASLDDGGYLVVSDDLKRERIPEPSLLGLVQIGDSCIFRKLSDS